MKLAAPLLVTSLWLLAPALPGLPVDRSASTLPWPIVKKPVSLPDPAEDGQPETALTEVNPSLRKWFYDHLSGRRFPRLPPVLDDPAQSKAIQRPPTGPFRVEPLIPDDKTAEQAALARRTSEWHRGDAIPEDHVFDASPPADHAQATRYRSLFAVFIRGLLTQNDSLVESTRELVAGLSNPTASVDRPRDQLRAIARSARSLHLQLQRLGPDPIPAATPRSRFFRSAARRGLHPFLMRLLLIKVNETQLLLDEYLFPTGHTISLTDLSNRVGPESALLDLALLADALAGAFPSRGWPPELPPAGG